MAALNRRASARSLTPILVRRPRVASPQKREVAGKSSSSSSSSLCKLLMQGLKRHCCQRRIFIPRGGKTPQQPCQRAGTEVFLDSSLSTPLPAFGEKAQVLEGHSTTSDFEGSSSSRANTAQVPVGQRRYSEWPLPGVNTPANGHGVNNGQSREGELLLPGLNAKKPARPLSRPRISTAASDLTFHNQSKQAFPFSSAFQEFFEQEAKELSEFVRMRSLTPPPRTLDFVKRSLASENGAEKIGHNFVAGQIAGMSQDNLSTSKLAPYVELHAKDASMRHVSSHPRLQVSSTEARRNSRCNHEVRITTSVDHRSVPSAATREMSPCFGNPQEFGNPQDLPDDAEESPINSADTPPATARDRSKAQTGLQIMVHPARQVPRVRRPIRTSPRGRQSPRGRRSLGNGNARATVASRNQCDESHSAAGFSQTSNRGTDVLGSKLLMRRSSSSSGLTIQQKGKDSYRGDALEVHLSPVLDVQFSPLTTTAQSAKTNGLSTPATVPPFPKTSGFESTQTQGVTSALKELTKSIPPLILPAASCDTTESTQAEDRDQMSSDNLRKQSSGDISLTEVSNHTCGGAKPDPGKGKGKGKAPPPPPKGLVPPPKAKASAKKGIAGTQARAVSEGPWYHGRPLYWREIPGAGEGSQSIFDKSATGGDRDQKQGFGFDWDEWNELFGSRADEAQNSSRRKSAPTPANAQGLAAEEPLICVLSQRQATSCSIILKRIDDVAGLSEALQNLDFEILHEDNLGRLRELVDIVEDSHIKRLRELSKQISRCCAEKLKAPNLRSIERQLLPLFDIDMVSRYIRLAQISCTLEAQRNRVCSTSAALANASKDVRNSKALKDFVDAAVSLRDYVHHGPEALTAREAPPRVMDIGSLLSGLREFKAMGPDSKKISLLQFFARSLLRMRPDFDAELLRELPGLADGRSLALSSSPWPALYDGLSQLQADATFAKGELTERAGAYRDCAISQLHSLVDTLTKAIVEANYAMASATSALEELGRYFGVPGAREFAEADKVAISRKDPSGILVLCQVATLLVGFCQTCADIREQHPQTGVRAPSVGRRLVPEKCGST